MMMKSKQSPIENKNKTKFKGKIVMIATTVRLDWNGNGEWWKCVGMEVVWIMTEWQVDGRSFDGPADTLRHTRTQSDTLIPTQILTNKIIELFGWANAKKQLPSTFLVNHKMLEEKEINTASISYFSFCSSAPPIVVANFVLLLVIFFDDYLLFFSSILFELLLFRVFFLCVFR